MKPDWEQLKSEIEKLWGEVISNTVIGPEDHLVIRADRMSDQELDRFRTDLAERMPGLVGRVLIVEAERADVYVVKPCGCQNRDGSAPECAPDA